MRAGQRRDRAGQAVAALAVAVALLLAAAAGPADARTRRHPPCSRHGSHTVVSTRHVRVYELANRDGGNNLFGCLRSNDRRQLLVHGSDDGYVTSTEYDRVVVAGRFVAWQRTDTDVSCKADCPPGYDPTQTAIFVRDLKLRKTRSFDGEADGELRLTRGGAVSWTQGGEPRSAHF